MEFFESAWSIIKTIQFRDIIDILAIALIIFGLSACSATLAPSSSSRA